MAWQKRSAPSLIPNPLTIFVCYPRIAFGSPSFFVHYPRISCGCSLAFFVYSRLNHIGISPCSSLSIIPASHAGTPSLLCPLSPHLIRVLSCSLCPLLPHLMRVSLALFVHYSRISCGTSPSLLSISSASHAAPRPSLLVSPASHAAPCPSLSITPRISCGTSPSLSINSASYAAPCPSLSISPESHSGILPLMVNPPLNLIRVSLKEHYSPAKNINTRLHDEKILVPINKKQYFCGKIQLIPCCY